MQISDLVGQYNQASASRETYRNEGRRESCIIPALTDKRKYL